MKNELKEVRTENAPKPVGSYSQGIIASSFLYCSGQIGLDPKTNLLVEGGIKQETEQVLENLKQVLTASNLSFGNVVRTDIFITNMFDFPKVNEVYAKFFTDDPKPARQTIEVSNLPKGALVEISCIAYSRKNL